MKFSNRIYQKSAMKMFGGILRGDVNEHNNNNKKEIHEEPEKPSSEENTRLASYCKNRPTNKLENSIAPGHTDSCKQVNITEFAMKAGGWRATPFIFGIATSDVFSSLGLQVNLISYLVPVLHLSLEEAANTVTNFGGMCSFAPLLGAFLADAFVGRYVMIILGSISYLLGTGLLTLEATVSSMQPRCPRALGNLTPSQISRCNHSSKSHIGYLYLAFFFIAMGAGGVRPSAAAFGADQFDQKDPVERKQLARIFNWYYFSINFSILIASTVLVYIQENAGWSWGFSIPGIAVFFSIIPFLAGSKLYRKFSPRGSPFTRLLQVMVASFRKRHLKFPSDPATLYQGLAKKVKGVITLKHTSQFRFLDRAAIIDAESDVVDAEKEEAAGGEDSVRFSSWRLCGVQQVEELKCLLKMLPIWASGIIVLTAWVQQNTLWVHQARTMDRAIGRNFHIPPASFSVFASLTLLSWVPIYDICVPPLARRLTGHERGITFLQRIGAGGFLAMLAMLVAGSVEIRRRHAALSAGLIHQPHATVPISAFWLVPQYCLIGLSEAFIIIGYLEFFYDQTPQSMRSMAVAIVWAIGGTGSYLSTFLVSTVTKLTTNGSYGGWISTNLNQAHLEYFYWLLAALLAANNIIYLILATSCYTYSEFDMDQLDITSKGDIEESQSVIFS